MIQVGLKCNDKCPGEARETPDRNFVTKKKKNHQEGLTEKMVMFLALQ